MRSVDPVRPGAKRSGIWLLYLLRGVVLALLIAAVVVAASSIGAGDAGEVVYWGGESGAGSEVILEQVLTSPTPPALVVRDLEEPPTGAELEALAALARRSPLLGVAPEGLPAIRVEELEKLQVDRRGVIRFDLRGAPGDSLRAVLTDEAGPVDSLVVEIDGRGEGSAAFRVRPVREGWQRWRIEATPLVDRARVEGRRVVEEAGGWVRPAEEIHLLLLSGPPSPEVRYLARALEEAGIMVTTSVGLGRELSVGADHDEYAGYDVVILMPGTELDGEEASALAEFVGEVGGGLLDAGAGWAGKGPGLGVARRWGERRELDARELEWAPVPELESLPATPVRGVGYPIEGVGPGTSQALADRRGETFLALGGHGRGRVAVVGLRESWRWRLEAGAADAHRDFWSGLVEWLSSGLRDPVIISGPGTMVGVGEVVELRVDSHGEWGAEGAGRLSLQRPDGRNEELELEGIPGESGGYLARFVPLIAGVHTISVGDGAPLTGVEVVGGTGSDTGRDEIGGPADPGTGVVAQADDSWARLALLVERSGGEFVERGQLQGRVESALEASSRGWGGRARELRIMLFVVLLSTATLEWSIRKYCRKPRKELL